MDNYLFERTNIYVYIYISYKYIYIHIHIHIVDILIFVQFETQRISFTWDSNSQPLAVGYMLCLNIYSYASSSPT